MKTKQLIYNTCQNSAIQEAANLLKQGEIVAFPTETVYGLGADATNENAVNKIFAAKGRPSDNPLIVHIADKHQLKDLAGDYPEYVDKLMESFSPGPITYVLASKGLVAANVSAGLNTVAIRIPSHPVALSLLSACQLPIAAPSANLSGKPSPTSARHVLDDLDGKIAAVLDGGKADVGLESTVLDCTGEYPVILRLGKVTKQQIENIVNVVINMEQNVKTPKSPGVKYKHYMPEIPLILVNNNDELQNIIDKEREQGKRVGALVSSQTGMKIQADKTYIYGHNEHDFAVNLYDLLRSMKTEDADLVIAEKVTADTVGHAVLDRLTKAATQII